MTPADELRQAAATLRDLAGKATPGEWKVNDLFGDSVMGIAYDMGEDDAVWVATMNPAVAEPLAKLLDRLADNYSRWTPDYTLDLARQINE